jgi:hypothetical protein
MSYSAQERNGILTVTLLGECEEQIAKVVELSDGDLPREDAAGGETAQEQQGP